MGIVGDDDVRGTGCGLGVEVDRLIVSLHGGMDGSGRTLSSVVYQFDG